jgi:hypothetical protein
MKMAEQQKGVTCIFNIIVALTNINPICKSVTRKRMRPLKSTTETNSTSSDTDMQNSHSFVHCSYLLRDVSAGRIVRKL